MPTEIERLYREHHARLIRLVERELRDHHDAEDVVQTAFLDAQRALEGGTVPRHPRAWLAAIALNAAHGLRRRRLNAEPLEECAAQEASESAEIREALASLPKEQRTAVLYRDLLGLSYGETAEQMRTSVNAVTMLLHRGRRRLRQNLAVTAGSLWLGRWLKRAGLPQVAAVKGAAAVVAAGGLVTAGAVAAGHAARAVAPIPADTAAAAPVTHSGRVTAAAVRASAVRTRVGALEHDRTHPRTRTTVGSALVVENSVGPASTVPRSTQAVGEASRTPSTSTVRLPGVVLPTPQTPTLPTSVATPVATVTVVTPITAVTATTPVGTTATVTTPLTTVSVPVP